MAFADFARAAGAAATRARQPGKYAITAGALVCEGFLQFSARREPAREGLPGLDQTRREWRLDRQPAILAEMVGLAAERAKLSGYCEFRRLSA